MMPLTANVAAVPASFFNGCTLGGRCDGTTGPLPLPLSPLLVLLSLRPLSLPALPVLLCSGRAAAVCAGSALCTQQPSTMGSYMSDRRVRLTVLFQRLPQKSASDVDNQGLSKGGTTSSSARLVSTAAGPFMRKLMKLHRARAAAPWQQHTGSHTVSVLMLRFQCL